MNEGPRYVTFRDYLRVVRERRLLVALLTLACVGGAIGWSVRQQPVYEAEASLEFRDVNVGTSLIGTVSSTGGQTPEQRAAVNAEGISRLEVAERARKILETPASVAQLQSRVTARPEARTHLVVVTARWGNADMAAKIANAFVEAARDVATEEVRELYEEAADAQREVLEGLGKSRSTRFPRIVQRQNVAKLEQAARLARPATIRRSATAPRTPVSPKPVRNAVLGLLLGLTLGLVAAFIRDSLDRRFKSSREITDQLHMPLLGFVREDMLGSSIVASKGHRALTATDLEGFRILRTNLEFLDVDRPPKMILVTSALPEEGKSTVSSGLAAAYATSGKRTLLVECDLRRPTHASRLGLSELPGLSDYLVSQAAPAQILQTLSLPSVAAANGHGPMAAPEPMPLVCITAGTPSPQPAELLRSARAKDFFAQVAEVYDAIVIDTSPLLSVVDALELIPIADAVVVCVRASQTTRDQARAAQQAIAHLPERPAGVVVTGIRARDEAGYYGYYSYGYVYGGERR